MIHCAILVFEMTAVPFPCNGILLCLCEYTYSFVNVFNKLASCSIPYFNLHLFLIEGGLALSLNSLGLFIYCVKLTNPMSNMNTFKDCHFLQCNHCLFTCCSLNKFYGTRCLSSRQIYFALKLHILY